MSGHSHWKQIKVNKGSADQKRAVLFSKLLRAISAAAVTEPNPQFNPRLRTAMETARAANVPGDNIERAISKARDHGPLEEMFMEAYGPAGSALFIHAISGSKNRTISEVKLILKECGGKWAEPGSVRWAFEEAEEGGVAGWRPKFPQPIPLESRGGFLNLVAAIEDHADVDAVYTNVSAP
jgi:transcriptional/translational regulatory protein YebC/TACO1